MAEKWGGDQDDQDGELIFNICFILDGVWCNMLRNLQHTPTWRIIPVSKWLVTPRNKPFGPFIRGITLFRGLTNHGY